MSANDQIDFIPEESAPKGVDIDFIPEDLPKEPDTTPIKKYVQDNLAKPDEGGGMLDAYEGFKKGLGASFLGMLYNGKLPDPAKEDATATELAATGIGQTLGDAPWIALGTIGGGLAVGGAGAAAGTAAGPAGTVAGAGIGGYVGASAGANALPAALRKTLMEYYEKGEITSASDFVERVLAVTGETVKEAAIGAVSGGVGGKVLKSATPVLGAAASKIASEGSEVMTMLAANSAIDGKLPDAKDVSSAALMVATIHGVVGGVGGVSKVTKKVGKIYEKTGIEPAKVADLAKEDPILQQELLTGGDEIPKSLEPLIDPEIKKMEADLPPPPPKEVTMADVLNEEPPPLTENHPAVREVLNRVKDRPETQSKVREFFNKVGGARGRYIDAKDPIKRTMKLLRGDSIDAESDAYILSRMEGDHMAKAIESVSGGTIDFNTRQRNGIGLEQAEAKVAPEKMGIFSAFLVAMRELDYKKMGKKIGFDEEALSAIRRAGEKEFGEAAKEVTSVGKRNLKYLADSGVISKKAFDAMDKSGTNWIPVRHRLDDAEVPKAKRKGNILKRTTGTDRQDFFIEDPRLAIRENAVAIFRAAERNRTALAMKKAFDDSGIELEKVTHKYGIDVSPEIKKFMNDAGIDGDGMADGIKAWRHETGQLGAGEFEVFEDGVRNVYKIPKDVLDHAPGLDVALSGNKGNYGTTGMLMDIGTGFAKLKRALITYNPAFQLTNFGIDQLVLGVQSKNGAIPFLDAAFAIKDIIAKNDKYSEWMRSGGAQGSLMKYDKQVILDSLNDANHTKAGFWDNQWNVLNPKNLKQASQAFGALLENSSHLAEFKRARKKGKSMVQAGFEAREATLDFEISAGSARMAALAQLTAFQRASIGGLDRTLRALTSKEERLNTAMKGMMYITAPTLMLYFANKDDPRVQDRPQWEKDNYWLIPISNWEEATQADEAQTTPEHLQKVVNGKLYIDKGYVQKIRKPHLYGAIFGTAIERSLDDFYAANPDAWNDFSSYMTQQMFPPEVPNMALPVFEQAFNKNLFTQQDIIPENLKNAAPELQYKPYTSETAKQLAKITPYITFGAVAAPAVVDNYIKSWGGPLGEVAINLIDAVIEPSDFEKPSEDWYNPMVKSFMARRPSTGADPINTFYDKAAKIEGELKSYKIKAGLGEADEEDFPQMGVASKFIKKTKKAMAAQRKLIKGVYSDPDMSREEKRQLIDGYTYMMIEEAKRAVEQINDYEKAIKGYGNEQVAAE